MDYQTYIRLVDSHAKRISRYHNPYFVLLPLMLAKVFFRIVQSGMVKGRGHTGSL